MAGTQPTAPLTTGGLRTSLGGAGGAVAVLRQHFMLPRLSSNSQVLESQLCATVTHGLCLGDSLDSAPFCILDLQTHYATWGLFHPLG